MVERLRFLELVIEVSFVKYILIDFARIVRYKDIIQIHTPFNRMEFQKRMNRTLMERVRSMLSGVELELKKIGQKWLP